MKCRDARAAISARFDDGDVGVDTSALEAHIASCAECRAEVKCVGFAWELLDMAEAPEPSPSFDERVLAELNRRGWFDRLCDWFEVPIRRMAATAALSGLVVACTFFAPHVSGPGVVEPSIIERQAAEAGIDLSNIQLPGPAQRSDGGAVWCA